MEIDITTFYNDCAPMDYAASVADIGRNAMEDSDEYFMLSTWMECVAMRAHLEEFGVWSTTEIDDWTIRELNAVLIQEIASAMRNLEGDMRLYKADGKVFYYLGL